MRLAICVGPCEQVTVLSLKKIRSSRVARHGTRDSRLLALDFQDALDIAYHAEHVTSLHKQRFRKIMGGEQHNADKMHLCSFIRVDESHEHAPPGQQGNLQGQVVSRVLEDLPI